MTATRGIRKTTWHTEDKVGQIDMRVSLVRMDYYRLLIVSRSEEDFYIEEAFNRFLAVAQSAMNFAVFDRNGLLFHFVNDVKYQVHFSKVFQKISFDSECLMPLFPQLFADKYKILVFQLNTKGLDAASWILPVVVDNERESGLRPNDPIDTHDRYLQRCAWRFFVDEWDGFRTRLRTKAAHATENSIQFLAANYRLSSRNKGNKNARWPVDQLRSRDFLDLDTPQEVAAIQHKNWHKKLRRLFERTMSDASSGLESQHLMMQHDQDSVLLGRKPLPNMIVAYRSFTRTSMRKGWSDRSEGYPYDTQLLVRDQDGGDNLSIVTFFNRLKELAKKAGGREDYQRGDDRGGRSRVLYCDVFSAASEKILLDRYGANSLIGKELKELAGLLDCRFWDRLRDDGAQWCLDILQSPVGENARSFVDPVYHTGLIHFNSIFELGGLDRVGAALKAPWAEGEREHFLEQNEADLFRIVILYYLFCEMADWGGGIGNFDPGRLEAVLVPIKMRGSVWAVTMHAAYRSEATYDKESNSVKASYEDMPRWMSVYHISTTLKQKNQELFDKVLWENTLRRIMRLLEKSFEEIDNIVQYQEALFSFNERVEWEQRYVPYALPLLSPDGHTNAAQHVEIKGASGKSHQVMWDICDNPYFAAAQPWRGVGTRTFQTAIEVGFNRGLTAQIRKMYGTDRSKRRSD